MLSWKKIANPIKFWLPAPVLHAHCDGPCGVYDPASARIAAEAVVSMTKKILDMQPPSGDDRVAMASYENTVSRYIQIKEEQAQLTKKELLVLWTDYFKPVHLEQFPQLHTKFWNAAKLCSACKVEVNLDRANELMDAIKEIQEMFWATKNRTDVPWYKAS
ncbi:MAG: superoxide dismutase, Ni [Cyanobacteriota bacterium]|nr:superoxide dismutase, Ni [Cyanobacteriota bacterium]